MNFTKYFKRKDYDNLDRFLLQQKFRSCRDPFEGDPFKIQSLNFRYADKPIFYPISNRSKTFGNAENSHMQKRFYNQSNYRYRFEKENKAYDNSKQSPILKNAQKSSSFYSFSAVSKPENLASSSMPESFQRGLNSVVKKNNFNRSRSFIDQPISVPFAEEAALPNHQTVLKKNLLKPKNSIGIKKQRTDLMPAINADHSGGCKITIKINGVPSNQVHINEKVENCDFSPNRIKPMGNSATPEAASPYELKPSRSYVIYRDDTIADISNEQRKSSRKLLRECSTHSMIPHKEEKITLKAFKKPSSATDTIGAFSSLRLKSGSRDITQSNLSRKASLVNLARKNLFTQRTLSEIKLEKQASMLEKILSNNSIVAPTKKSFLLTKSKSVLNQRFTPLPMSRKYTFENTNSRTRLNIL